MPKGAEATENIMTSSISILRVGEQGSVAPEVSSEERLHEGVIRDLERQSRKLENIRLLQEQITLTKQLEAERDKMLMEKGSHQS
ncbi:protein PET117 homolog, mitochondrial [Terrapene carolina triunguis]|uniref:protein PET117 homolog, mitochondrial n=1 Tax=Terrapene triunguis TaxID=2587831 RepID=UPI000E778B7C|nr:protein PET117 homolog, mitochondrial [Terrapene carolina triunguis]